MCIRDRLYTYEKYYDASDGSSLITTIDSTVQAYVEKNLQNAIDKYDIKNGAFCIVMDVNTGEIKAMATLGSYDPNNYLEIYDDTTALLLENERAAALALPEASAAYEAAIETYKQDVAAARMAQWRNRCVSDGYEPGSTFKLITLASALDSGAVTLNDSFYCGGQEKFTGREQILNCWKSAGHGAQTTAQALGNSCNIAFGHIGLRMGGDTFYDYLKSFGVMEKTGVDLPGEASGLFYERKYLNDPANYGTSYLITSSFGQSFRITPMQLVRAVAAIVNGGYVLEPYIVSEVVDADEFVAANKAAKAAGKAIAKFRPIHNYSSVNEAIAAYAAGTVGLHAPIRVRYGKKIDGEMRYRIIDATVGRLIYNEAIPQDLGFVDRSDPETMFDPEINFVVGKKQLGKIIDKCIRRHGFTIATEMLDRIKALGYKYSTKGAISVSIADMVVPSVKYEMVHSAEKKVVEIEHFYRQGFITNDERYRLVVQQWEKTTADVTNALQGSMDEFNPIYMMADSGARGSMAQIRQLAGMRGLMADTAGRTIEIPVKANFREGLSVLEYFISSRGARKGMTDTALRTADSGYLTRRMVDVSQDVIIREHNCGTTNGIWVGAVYDKNGDVIDTFGNRIRGRYPVHDVVDPQTGELLHSKDVMMMPEDAEKFEQHGINKIYIRTILGCRARVGVCAKCYGMNLATSKEVDLGEAVGIIAAQSIGEPGTQLTMRTFHSGGVAGDDITQGLPRVEELFEARRPKKMAQISEITGVVSVDETHRTALRNITVTADDGEVKVYQVPYSVGLKVAHGKVVEKGQPITDGALYPQDVLRISGVEAVQDYLVQSVQAVYRQQGVEINDKHIEVIIRQMMRKVRVEDPGDTALLTGSAIDNFEFEDANAEIQRRIDAGETELRPATASAMLLGITKAALATDSFLSAASFQETTKVLTDAAIKGKVDHLVGLKENVLIGKLIPAGSGLMAYRDYQPGATPEARIPEEMIENALN